MQYDYKQIEKLRMISFQTAFQVTHSHEESEDIAQDVLMSAIKYNDIKSMESWVRVATKNKAISFIRKQVSNKRVKLNLTPKKNNLHVDICQKLDKRKICKLLSKEDYLVYKNFSLAKNSIKTYCENTGQKYNAGRKKIEVMKKNLQSRYLYQLGFRSELILNYNEWQIIYKFLSKYIDCSNKGNFSPIKHYFRYSREEIYVQMDKYVTFCMIRSEDKKYFNMVLFGESNNRPVFLVFTITFLKNSFRVVDCFYPPYFIELSGSDLQIFEESVVKVNDYYVDNRSLEEVAEHIINKKKELGVSIDKNDLIIYQ